jgi:hypothetical protein
MLYSNNEIICYFILFSIYTSIILIIDNNIIFIFSNITIIITYNIISLEYELVNINKYLYEILIIKNINYLYNTFKIIIKKSYEIILLIIFSEKIINDFEDLYKSNYIFSLYNSFKIIIIIKKSYEIIELYKKK